MGREAEVRSRTGRDTGGEPPDYGDIIIRNYAAVFGIGFLAVWLLGLRSTSDAFGALNSDWAEDFFHLATGLTLCYAAFVASPRNRDAAITWQAAVYLVIGVYAFLNPEVFGLFPHGLGPVDNATHLVEGVLSLILVRAFGTARHRSPATSPAM